MVYCATISYMLRPTICQDLNFVIVSGSLACPPLAWHGVTAKIVPIRNSRKESVVSVNLEEFFGGAEYASTGCIILNTPCVFLDTAAFLGQTTADQ